jgi:conjugative relaxase-like TrwC/TraI family protein
MTMHILSAGDGYAYYTNKVATGDIKREPGRELGDYYTVDGNPPGIWAGAGLGLVGVHGSVSEDQMRALFGEGLHPNADQIIKDAQDRGLTAEQAQDAARLGRGYYVYGTAGSTLAGRIDEGYAAFERMNHREPSVTERRVIRAREGAQAFRDAKGRQAADKEELGRFITAATRPTQQAVAGFDMVFSPAKSVSTLWALGDDTTRKAIEKAHEEAIAETVKYIEREAVATRAGRNGVAQIDVEGGIIATRFRHYDSRNGDPQLHDHLVVANKVKGSDGKWRTLDSKLLHRMNVPASEFYNQAVVARVCQALDVTTELREVTPGKRPVVEIAGVDTRLTEGFSSRSVDIKKRMQELEDEYRVRHGRGPNEAARIHLAQQATLDTRPAKETARSLSELNRIWREKAIGYAGEATVTGLVENARRIKRDQSDETEPVTRNLEEVAQEVVETVSEHRAVWGTHHLEAEARRWVASQGPAASLPADAVEEITRLAVRDESVTVTPPPAHGTFQPLTRRNGDSIYNDKGRSLHTSRTVLDAEDMLLDAARDRTMSPVSRETFDRAAAKHGQHLDAGQRALAAEFACSPSRIVVGSGPAGTGKTTALKVAARAVEDEGGRMVGLAPSAVAASVMRDAIGIQATTIDKLLVGKGSLRSLNERTDLPERTGLRAGDVIVVDEAGMAGTVKLAKVTRLAELAGAHVRLIGDDRQLSAVEAGGALRLIEHEVRAVHLDTVHRFTDPEEAAASTLLRDPAKTGDPFAWYLDKGRAIGGDRDRMTEAVFAAWQADTNAGRESVMLAQQNATVQELNARAQAYRVGVKAVRGDASVPLRDGLAAHVGDRIVTRENSGLLTVNRGRDMVKNGDLWTVAAVREDGSLSVVHDGHGGRITLPSEYVQRNVELGYASTVHRAQGITVDTAHVLADASTSREVAYVGLTRGRETNRIYVETGDGEAMADVLAQIGRQVDTSPSAHEAIRQEQQRMNDVVTLSDEYGDVAERANHVRFERVAVDVFGAERAGQLTDQESWGALEAALRQAERNGYDPAATLRSAEAQRELDTADDVPAVLSHRIEQVLEARGPAAGYEPADPDVPRWVADPLPLSSKTLPEDWREHLQERYDYLGVRLHEQGEAVAAEQPAWSAELGRVPDDEQRREQWTRLAAEVDTFRARYQVPETEENAVPEKYRTNQVGKDLAARVTQLHKSDELRRHAAERQAREKIEHGGPQTADREQEKATATARLDEWRREQDAQRRREEQQRQQGTWGPDQPGGPTHERRGPRL